VHKRIDNNSEEEVVRFWNELDEEVEFALDVVDDLHAEAKEIRAAGNHWLTYAPCLHMVREGGTRLKLLDLLDERRFTPAEVRRLPRPPAVGCIPRTGV